jgi:hypothetical protein
MAAIVIMVLWTWGLTPLWVNITGTVIMGLNVIYEVAKEWNA